MTNSVKYLIVLIVSFIHIKQVRNVSVIEYPLRSNFFSRVIEMLKIPLLDDIRHKASDIIRTYKAAKNNPDKYLDITGLAQKYGYPIKKYHVQTEDGYILTMFRIIGDGSPVLLMHGLISSADDWVTAGPESGVAYILASAGYDVWLGNARGNKYSRRHVSLSPDKNAQDFWDFSWHEIGRYDLPATIDYILYETNATKIKYVGHSQGCTCFFVLCSEKPEYNDKISIMVALSPVSWMSHLKSPILKLFSPTNPFLYRIAKLFGMYEFVPSSQVTKTFAEILCGATILATIICSNVLFFIGGFSFDQLNITNLPVIYAHVPSGAAAKQFVHYGQGIVSGEFRQFDYGKRKNEELYGSSEPPAYAVESITAPVALFYSDTDWLCSTKDVNILQSKLPNVVEYYKVPLNKFNHFDYLWAKDVKELVVDKIQHVLRLGDNNIMINNNYMTNSPNLRKDNKTKNIQNDYKIQVTF